MCSFMLGEMTKSTSIEKLFLSCKGILQLPNTSMGVPLTVSRLELLGNTSLRFTKCTGNKLTSQPESHKQSVNTPFI